MPDSPGERRFWRMTPRQLHTHFEAAGLRRRREHNDRAWLAWNTAALGRSQKKLPALKRLQVAERQAPRQTPDQHLAILKSIVAAFSALPR